MAARRCGNCIPEQVYPEEGFDARRMRKNCIRCCLCWDCLSGPAPERVRPFTDDVFAPLLPNTSNSLVGFIDRCIACGKEHSEDDELVCRRRKVCLGVYIASSMLLLTICYYMQNFAAATALGAPSPFKCGSQLTKYSMASGHSQCGLLGVECRPFDTWVPIRCDGWCSKAEEHEHEVFGSGPYRADSSVCRSAVHSGIIGDGGGCVDIRIGGPACSFTGGLRNGIRAQAFHSWFPVTLDLRPSRGASSCGWDGWWALLLVNVVLLWGLTFLRPSRQLWFWSLVISLYWYAALGSSSYLSGEVLLIRGGSCGLLVLCCHWLLWDVGGAKTFLPNFEAGAPFDGLMEILVTLPLLHQHRLQYLTGDHGFEKETFSEAQGPLFFGVVALIVLPIVIWMLRRWWFSGVLRGLACTSLAVILAVVMLSLLFATSNFSFHLHHYFFGLMGCLFFRGNSRIAAVMRALCLGSFINGIAFWGFADNLPIWSHSPGDAEGLTPWRKSSTPNYTAFASPKGRPSLTQLQGSNSNTTLTISWTHLNSGDQFTRLEWCKRLAGERFISGYAPDRAWVLEMNNIEIYRGRGHRVSFNISDLTKPCSPRPYHFMLGTLDSGPWGIPQASRKFTLDTSKGLPDADSFADNCFWQSRINRSANWPESLNNISNESPFNISNESLLNTSDWDANSSVLNASP